jgi:hypothetical protein
MKLMRSEGDVASPFALKIKPHDETANACSWCGRDGMFSGKRHDICSGMWSYDDDCHPPGVHHPDGIQAQTTKDSLKGALFMKRTARVIRKQFWFTLGFVVMMTIMAAGPLFAAALTQEEKDWLLYMREEEKVARDVYIALYDKWGLTIFNNISKSEQTHMGAIKTLLDRYGLPDPAKAPGEFTNTDLKDLYDALIIQGNVSVTEALNVGVLIEETDIDDLTKALAETIHKDITRVYQNLRNGSYNHLAAFESKL